MSVPTLSRRASGLAEQEAEWIVGMPGTQVPLVEFVQKACQAPNVGVRARVLLEQVAVRFAAPLAVLRFVHDGHDIHQRWRSKDGSEVNWLPVLEALGFESESSGEPRGTVLHEDDEVGTIAGLAVPLIGNDGNVLGSAAVLVFVPDESSPNLLLAQFAGTVAFVNTALLPGKSASPGEIQDVAANASHQPSMRDLAISVVGTLRARTGAVQVAFGVLERGRARLEAVSGVDEAAERSAGSVAIRQAMEECADRGTPIRCSEFDAELVHEINDAANETEAARLHDQWRQIASGANLLSVPIAFGKGRVAVVSLLRAAHRPFTDEETEELHAVLARLAPSLEVMRRSTRSLRQHGVDRVLEAVSRMLRPNAWKRRVPALAVLGFMTWVLFGWMDHSVSVGCTYKPAAVLHVSAPREGRLLSAAFREGDRVEEGDVLCRFDDTGLVLQRAELRAEIESLDVEGRQHVAAADLTAARLVDAKREIAVARLASIENRIAQAEVKASRGGLIVQGDLSQRIGQILPLGEPLFEVAADDGVHGARLELHVPEHHALDVREGAQVRFVGNARPDERADFHIERIVPSAEVLDGANVFRAVARFDGDEAPAWARPGMEGIAEVALGRRPVRDVLLARLDRWVSGWLRP